MIICESGFDVPDFYTPPEHMGPDYSLREIDYYSWISLEFQEGIDAVRNHRLSLRKNLKENVFEVIRAWSEPRQLSNDVLSFFGSLETGAITVAFKSPNLKDAIDFCNKEVERFHGHPGTDEVCQHKYPHKASECKIND